MSTPNVPNDTPNAASEAVKATEAVGAAAAESSKAKPEITMTKPTPIFRIFDEKVAKEFYLDFLGFEVSFEHRFGEDMPLYLGLKRGDVQLHLSEHHGDSCPGSAVRICVQGSLDAYFAEIKSKNYKKINPGILDQTWGCRELIILDPFGNRVIFFEDV